jgi:hypothetical protein
MYTWAVKPHHIPYTLLAAKFCWLSTHILQYTVSKACMISLALTKHRTPPHLYLILISLVPRIDLTTIILKGYVDNINQI